MSIKKTYQYISDNNLFIFDDLDSVGKILGTSFTIDNVSTFFSETCEIDEAVLKSLLSDQLSYGLNEPIWIYFKETYNHLWIPFNYHLIWCELLDEEIPHIETTIEHGINIFEILSSSYIIDFS